MSSFSFCLPLGLRGASGVVVIEGKSVWSNSHPSTVLLTGSDDIVGAGVTTAHIWEDPSGLEGLDPVTKGLSVEACLFNTLFNFSYR